MTMIDGMASLEISSVTHLAGDVTTALGILPDFSAEKGSLRVRADGAPVSGRRAYHEEAVWSLSVDSTPATMMAVDEDDQKSLATLYVLVDRLLGRGPMLAELRKNYSTRIAWYGTADGGLGGFVMPIGLMRDLAELGCDFYANVYGALEL